MTTSSAQCEARSGVFHANGSTSDSSAAPTIAPQINEVSGCSSPAILRVRIWYSALQSAIAIGSSAYSVKTDDPGRTTASAPANPTAIAARRDASSRSFSIGTASAATKSGSTNAIAAASASGSTVSDVK